MSVTVPGYGRLGYLRAKHAERSLNVSEDVDILLRHWLLPVEEQTQFRAHASKCSFAVKSKKRP
jgi:hypothetical protein